MCSVRYRKLSNPKQVLLVLRGFSFAVQEVQELPEWPEASSDQMHLIVVAASGCSKSASALLLGPRIGDLPAPVLLQRAPKKFGVWVASPLACTPAMLHAEPLLASLLLVDVSSTTPDSASSQLCRSLNFSTGRSTSTHPHLSLDSSTSLLETSHSSSPGLAPIGILTCLCTEPPRAVRLWSYPPPQAAV
jgi:hypothetical protein